MSTGRMNVDLTGLDLSKLQRAVDAIPDALTQALEHVQVVAEGRTPKDTGHLASSSRVELMDPETARITYPGPYAAYQELREELKHDDGSAHYLGGSLRSEAETAVEIAGNVIKGAL